MSDKVLFTEIELSVHQNSISGSRTLLPGQYVSFTDLPGYLREAVERGDVPGVRVVTEEQALLLSERYVPEGFDPAIELESDLAEPGEEETPVEDPVGEFPTEDGVVEEVAE